MTCHARDDDDCVYDSCSEWPDSRLYILTFKTKDGTVQLTREAAQDPIYELFESGLRPELFTPIEEASKEWLADINAVMVIDNRGKTHVCHVLDTVQV